jgi:hypothetical protein
MPRDALVKIFNDFRIPFNADAFIAALDAAGLKVVAKEPAPAEAPKPTPKPKPE